MAPSTNPHIVSQLRQLIYYHLDNSLLKNALFLAGRLYAYDQKNAEAAYLLALCQYQSGLCKSSFDTSRMHAIRGIHLGCAYTYAQACLELGRYVEGISALDRCRPLWSGRNSWNQHSETRRQHLPDAAAVLCLKGKLWKAHKDMDQAVENWAAALKINPFMWDAFTGLCESGAKISVPNIYKINPEMMSIMQAAQKENIAPVEKSNATGLPTHNQATNQSDPFLSSYSKTSGVYNNAVLGEKNNVSKISLNTVSTILDEEELNASSTVLEVDDVFHDKPFKQVDEPPNAPVRKARSAQEMATETGPPRMRATSIKSRIRGKIGAEDAAVHQDPPAPAPATKRTVSGQPTAVSMAETRRSNRLANTSRPGTATGAGAKIQSFANSLGLREGRDIKKARGPTTTGRKATTATVGRAVSGNHVRTGTSDAIDVERQNSSIPPVPQLPNYKIRSEIRLDKEVEALKTLLEWFRRLAQAQLALSNYDTQTALQTYNSLPSHQRETVYVWSQMGKCYYEQASYNDAEHYFLRVRDATPSRLDDMEFYSTVLWHLKSEIDLAYLAHELVDVDRLSPQAWSAIGNSFSLQREHEQALKCFRRATQLDPSFAYGFTLQGHEYIANEEFEKALDAYRLAISADARHYNAWYGLGKVYEKMGKWDVAEQHYRTAARINPGNAVLICCIGVVQEKQKQPEAALAMYTRACNLQPQSALSRFKKARCLMGLGRIKEALAELVVLKDIAPEEANVWFLMGRLYKMLGGGYRGEAVRCFTVALNLDPKAAQFIKDAMESLDDSEGEEGWDEDEDDEMS